MPVLPKSPAELIDPECFKTESQVPSKNIFSTHTKIWGFEFHKSVPRGTLFRQKSHQYYILWLIHQCGYSKIENQISTLKFRISTTFLVPLKAVAWQTLLSGNDCFVPMPAAFPSGAFPSVPGRRRSRAQRRE